MKAACAAGQGLSFRQVTWAWICIVMMLFAPSVMGQQSTWVFFRDKGPAADALLERPEAFLTAKALERREAQHLAVDLRDLPVWPAYLDGLRHAGYEVVAVSRWLNAAVITHAASAEKMSAQFDFVRGTRPVMQYQREEPVHAERTEAPLMQSGKTHALDYGGAAVQNNMLQISCLHDRGFTGEGILMAVLDDGFLSADTLRVFDTLWSENRVIAWRDFVNADTLFFDGDPHGTKVLSTIAADQSGLMIGTAPKATFILGITEDLSSETHQEEYNWVSAMEWADSLGAQIIHTSLNYSVMDPGQGSYTYADMDGNSTIIAIAADIAASRGILVVDIAGNKGSDPWHHITTPCDADSALCVGAVNAGGMKAGFSSFGPSSDGRVKPDVMAMGLSTIVFSHTSANPITGSGTSFAAPIIAGMAACLLQAHPARSNMDIIHAIRMSADRFTTPDSLYGYGIPDACKADSLLSLWDSVGTARDQARLQMSIQLFPNPVQDVLSLRKDKAVDAVVSVMDVTGRVMRRDVAWRKGESELRVDAGELPAGVYLVRVEWDEGSWTGKMVRE